MAPKAGKLIRITAVKERLCTNIRVGTVMVVGEDERPPPFDDLDGYFWVQSQDYPKLGSASGWVKWEAIVLVTETEHTEVAARVKKTEEQSARRIKQLENEVLRLSSPPGTSFGWHPDGIEIVSDTPLPAIDTDKLHARCGRQRRELRRLNQKMRLMTLELQNAQRLNEELGSHCVDQLKKIRVLESAVK